MEKTLSKDGTPIAFDRLGSGPALVLVDAVIRAAGGSAGVFGCSSGAALALEAAGRLNGITRLALYEAPFIVDNTHPPLSPTFVAETRALIDAGKRGEALKKFMRLVGTPAPFVWLMPLLPFWKKLKAVAHTLTSDLTIVEPYQQGRALTKVHFANVRVAVLVMAGGKSPAYMQNGMKQLAGVLPNATYLTLAGQTHRVKDTVVAPELVRFMALAPTALPVKELALSR